MPRKFFRKFLPHPHRRSHHADRRFHRFSHLLHNPALWHLNRHSVSRAIALGVFWSFFPLPGGQTLLSTLCAIKLRANVGLAAIFTWVNNPLTMAPAAYLAYSLGRILLQQPPIPDFQPTLSWAYRNGAHVLAPFLLGSLLLSILLSGLSYVLSQEFWKWRVSRRWRLRPRHPAIENVHA